MSQDPKGDYLYVLIALLMEKTFLDKEEAQHLTTKHIVDNPISITPNKFCNHYLPRLPI